MPKSTESYPDGIRAYINLGIELSYRDGEDEAIANCPFCDKEKKLYINVKTSTYHCKRCGDVGNALLFARKYLELCFEMTNSYRNLVDDKCIQEETLIKFGVAEGLDGQWLIPSFGAKGNVVGISRYSIGGKVFGTKTLNNGMFLPGNVPSIVDTIYVCEGPWDAMAASEVCPAGSVAIGVPGAGAFNKSWLESSVFTDDREIVLLFDNDYPKVNQGKKVQPAGYAGAKRTIGILSEGGFPPENLFYLKWGKEGYDPNLPEGYDVRDALNANGDARESRVTAFVSLLDKVVGAEKEWLRTQRNVSEKSHGELLAPLDCDNYRTLVMAWRKAMKWTDGLDCALSVMLASSLSTKLVGEQLWVKVISPPGSGKTTLVEGLSVAREYALSKDTIRGFYTGWQHTGGEDTSIAALAKDRTLIIKDGDTLLKSPNLSQILSEGRGLYDGAGRTHYRNTVSRDYEGHRMTWILCGTSALREIDDSELGSRFLDIVIMDGIDEEFEGEVCIRSGNSELDNLYLNHYETNGSCGKPEDLSKAMRLTGGYVNYLRENDVEVISTVQRDPKITEYCSQLGQFVSRMRARPSKSQEEEYTREFSARLVKQFVRLSVVLAAVMNRSKVDQGVLERVRKVAKDTSRGITLDIARILYEAEDPAEGYTKNALATLTDTTDTRMRTLLQFLRKIQVITSYRRKKGEVRHETRYKLTPKMYELYSNVMGED